MKIPKKINKKSDKEQIKQTGKIKLFFKPCSITNIFCAPNAKIKLIIVLIFGAARSSIIYTTGPVKYYFPV